MAGMTKEEALKEIDERYRFWQKHYAPECEKYGKALGLSIEALKKLQHYEDLQEAGRLVELPCKVGDTVWVFSLGVIYPFMVEDFEINKYEVLFTGSYCGEEERFKHWGIRFSVSNFGKTVFLTCEEAETALKGGGQDD